MDKMAKNLLKLIVRLLVKMMAQFNMNVELFKLHQQQNRKLKNLQLCQELRENLV